MLPDVEIDLRQLANLNGISRGHALEVAVAVGHEGEYVIRPVPGNVTHRVSLRKDRLIKGLRKALQEVERRQIIHVRPGLPAVAEVGLRDQINPKAAFGKG